MNIFFYIILVSSVTLSYAATQDTTKYVVSLSDDTFDSTTSSGIWMLEFFAPWCGHCKHLAPIYENSAKALVGTGVKFAAIDATQNKELANRFDISGFPRIMFKLDGWSEPRKYKGNRTVEGFTDWARRMTTPAIHTIKTERMLVDLYEYNDVVFVLGNASVESELGEVFSDVAENIRDTQTFGILEEVDDSTKVSLSSLKNYFSSGKPFIAKLQPGEDAEVFDAKHDFSTWITQNKFPMVTRLHAQNFYDFTHQDGVASVILIVDYSSERNIAQAEKLLQSLARVNRTNKSNVLGKFGFAHLDGNKWSEFVKAQFGVTSQMLPHLFVLDTSNKRFFQPQDEFTTMKNLEDGAAESFVQQAASGELRGQYEGWLGWPSRVLWKTRHYPRVVVYGASFFLFFFVALIAMFLVSVVKDICCEPEDEDDVISTKKKE